MRNRRHDHSRADVPRWLEAVTASKWPFFLPGLLLKFVQLCFCFNPYYNQFNLVKYHPGQSNSPLNSISSGILNQCHQRVMPIPITLSIFGFCHQKRPRTNFTLSLSPDTLLLQAWRLKLWHSYAFPVESGLGILQQTGQSRRSH